MAVRPALNRMAAGSSPASPANSWTKPCPKCGKVGTHHLMMAECDDCINALTKKPERFIKRCGLLVPNPEYKE